ncbi:hypothetical protein PLIIFM63780_007544 [Purpureocillium lilacinum]|uniref:uncharacterized protein n=1 Tax=Purpureocillium lilacinum TaxID=33203 RepID=UPI002088C37C|nr:hypothetical protein PLICBS_007564 [Purpureocillium lilacinum]GJN83993.1 hypothetical protein PLIIFM63780_007544 [Purpureocillium lilacinum]
MLQEPFDFARDFQPDKGITAQCFDLIIDRLRKNYHIIQLFSSASHARDETRGSALEYDFYDTLYRLTVNWPRTDTLTWADYELRRELVSAWLGYILP